MNAPRPALHLAAAAWIAAAGTVHAEVFHDNAGPARSMVVHARPLSSTFTLRAYLVSLPGVRPQSIDAGMSTDYQGLLDQELTQLRDGIGRVRPLPQLSLGGRAHF